MIEAEIKNIDDAVVWLSKWVPVISDEDKYKLISSITADGVTNFLEKYVEMLSPYIKYVNESDLVSSAAFFFFCMFYIMHYPNWAEYIQDIFLYNMLYILFDYYIDDSKKSSDDKTVAIRQMEKLLYDPEDLFGVNDDRIKTIASLYNKLLQRHMKIKPLMIKLFYSEIKGLKIQNSDNHKRDTYYDIAIEKGGITVEILNLIVNDGSLLKESFDIGAIIQLIDDCADVTDDIKNNIHTVATHDLNYDGCLDLLWVDTVNRISKISSKFNMFKLFCSFFILYVPGKHRKHYSDYLLSKISPINWFDFRYGFDAPLLLFNALRKQLYQHDHFDAKTQ